MVTRHHSPRLSAPSPQAGALRSGLRGIAIAAVLLAGCANPPSLSEAGLVADNESVWVSDLHCPRGGNLLAVGRIGAFDPEGVVLYSEDRGLVWKRAPLDPAPDGRTLSLVRVPAPNAEPGLHLAAYRRHDPERLGTHLWWKPVDGGRSWVPSPPALPLGKRPAYMFTPLPPTVVLADRSGILVAAEREADGVFLLRSTDWGEHWSKTKLPMPRDFAGPIVSDGHGNLAFHGQSRPRYPLDEFDDEIYWSPDAGVTWDKGRETDGGWRGISQARLFRGGRGTLLAFDSGQRDGGMTLIHYSTDSGRSWTRSRVEPGESDNGDRGSFGRMIGVAGDARGRLIAFMDFIEVLLSDDDGVSWRRGRLPDPPSGWGEKLVIEAPVAFDAGSGIVVAALGNRILRSPDRGDTWAVVDSGLVERDFRFSSLCADGSGLIVAAGEGMVTRSLDGGLTWQPGRME